MEMGGSLCAKDSWEKVGRKKGVRVLMECVQK